MFKDQIQLHEHNLLAYERYRRGCKFTPGCNFARVQICNRVQIVHINEALEKKGAEATEGGLNILAKSLLQCELNNFVF